MLLLPSESAYQGEVVGADLLLKMGFVHPESGLGSFDRKATVTDRGGKSHFVLLLPSELMH